MSHLTDGQALVATFFGLLILLPTIVICGAWVVASLRDLADERDPNLRALRVRAHDNAAAALDGHRGVSTPQLKEKS